MGASWSNNVRMNRAASMTTATSGPPPIPSAFKPSVNSRPAYPQPQPRAPPAALPETRAPAPTSTPAPPTPANTKKIVAFHSAASWRAYFEASKASNKLIVVDFTATWCGPCRYMEPTLNECAAKYTDVDFIKIDVDELTNVASEFGIQAMPTFLFLKNGKEVDKVVGARKEELQRKIEKHRV